MRLPALLFLLLIAPATARSQTGTCAQSLGEAYLDVGNVRARILNNGNLFWRGSPHVYNVPKGGPANAMFAGGIWLGGMVGRQLRMAGSTYGPYEFWAGPLDEGGRPPADCSAFDRVYRVSRSDVRRFESTGAAEPDLADWPTGLGAPTLDIDGNPIDVMHLPLSERLDRRINLQAGERPLLTGDQMLWWVMNDRGNTHTRTDAASMGMEVHVSAYAFASSGTVGNTTFFRYRMFYRGAGTLTGVYLGMFSDPDLGNFDDDYVGSDSLLGLAFVYNADNMDEGSEGYGEAPPAVGWDFLESPFEREFGGVVPGEETGSEFAEPRRMAAFLFYNGSGSVTGSPGNGSDMYNFVQGRWKDGQRMTYGGNGRDFSNIRTSYMFSAMPPAFWSELNAESGRPIAPADRRFVASTGPWEMSPGDQAEVTLALIASFGADNLDSVLRLKQDSRAIQSLHDSGYAKAEPPDPPRVTVTERDGEALIRWTYHEEDNNYLDGYTMPDPALLGDVPDRNYRFEGYNVYRYAGASDQEGRLLATYDLRNGVTRVLEGEPIAAWTAWGSDSGLRHHYRATGLTNYRSYWFGVEAYAYNPYSGSKVLRGPVTRVEVVPSYSSGRLTPAGEDFLNQSADLIAEGLGAFEAFADPANIGTSAMSVNLVGEPTGQSYEVRFIHTGETGSSAPRLSLSVVREDGMPVFDGHNVPLPDPPVGIDVVRFDGLSLNVWTAEPGIGAIEVVSNKAGPVVPPVTGAPAWLGYPTPEPGRGRQQSTTSATWMIVTGQSRLCQDGDCSPYETFLARTVEEQGGWHRVVPYQWEIRFTDRVSYAWEPWIRGAVIEVPFELWRTGINTPDDRSDDVRLIPTINDIDSNGRFNLLLSDHPASPGPDDAFTDWIYWHLPLDESPGDAGYRAWLAEAQSGGQADMGPVTLGRIALMNWNGTDGEPVAGGGLNAWMPEPGTTFRIRTSASAQPGDAFRFTTSSLLQDSTDEAPPPIGITPNPYKGASEYEVSQLTDQVRFTNMPHRATIRVFQLGGSLVRTLEKNSPDRYFTWDLRTDENLPIASGMYLIHIDTPGGDHILKFGVVKKAPRLNVF